MPTPLNCFRKPREHKAWGLSLSLQGSTEGKYLMHTRFSGETVCTEERWYQTWPHQGLMIFPNASQSRPRRASKREPPQLHCKELQCLIRETIYHKTEQNRSLLPPRAEITPSWQQLSTQILRARLNSRCLCKAKESLLDYLLILYTLKIHHILYASGISLRLTTDRC